MSLDVFDDNAIEGCKKKNNKEDEVQFSLVCDPDMEVITPQDHECCEEQHMNVFIEFRDLE